MKYAFVLVTVVGLVIESAGCGGGNTGAGGSGAAGSGGASAGSSASCEKVAACGGTLTGEWTITQICPDQPGPSADVKAICETAELQIGSATGSGSIRYNADLTFTQMATIDAMGMLILPPACLKQGNTTLTCKAVQDIFRMDAGAAQIACSSTSNGGCTCTNPVHQVTSNTGTYAVNGSTVMLTTSTDKGTAEYCVKGTKLYLHTTVSSQTAGTGGGFTPSGQLVLDKK
jgi:hypothetical protein